MDSGRPTSPPPLLDRLAAPRLDRDDMTIEELLEATNEFLTAIAPRQHRPKVTERPDVRTVRYYVAKKLLPKPKSYAGGRARYSGRHLIRLLFIKLMQAEDHSLKEIARMLRRSSDEQLRMHVLDAPWIAPQEEPVLEQATTSVQEPVPADINRFHLSRGGVVEVPREVLRDADGRKELAESLRSLARWILTCKPRLTEDEEP